MNRITKGMVVAAVALLPVSVASAQEQPDGQRHEHRGGQGSHEGFRPGSQPGAAPQGAPRPNGQAQGGFRPQPPANDGARFQGQPRPDAGGRFPGGGGQGGYRGPFGNGGDPRFPDHGGQGGYRPQPGQPGYQPQPNRPFYPPTGGQGGYRPQPGQPGFHDRGSGWPGARGPGFAPGAPRWGNQGPGGGWTRGWRDDHRYDWHRYRVENRFVFNLPRYYAPRGWGYGYRRFDIGVTLGAPFFAQDYWLDDPYDYRLPPAYGPYRWVRYYNDALLVDIETGEVIDAVYGIFY